MRFVSAVFALIAAAIALPAAAQLIEVPGRAAAPTTTDTENLWLLDLSNGGRVTIWLRPDVAPKMVERVKALTRRKFYDNILFHRVIDGFMAQGGDPKGDGTGGSELPDLEAEFNYLPHVRGAVSAAREGAPEGATPEQKKKAESSANSQFFIIFSPRLSLDRDYTVFGRVIDGMQHVDAIERGEPPANPTRIVRAWIGSDNPPRYVAPVAAPAPAPAVMVDPLSLPPGAGRKVPPAK